MNRLSAIALLLMSLSVLPVRALADDNATPERVLTSAEVSRIIHAATDTLEARCPDLTEYAYYHVMPDGSTRSFTQFSDYNIKADNSHKRGEIKRVISVIDSVSPYAVNYDMSRATLRKDEMRRTLNFKHTDEKINRQLELSRHYEDPLFYDQTLDLLFFARGNDEDFFSLSHFWRTASDSTYAVAADLSDLEKEFARLLDEYGTQVEKVRFDGDDGYAGVLRLRPDDSMHISGTLLCMPLASATDWVKLYRKMWNHFGTKGQISFSYSRSRNCYITDYIAKKIYAISYINGKLFFLKAIYDERPFLPNDWRPDR